MYRRYFLALGILALLTPLGLLAGGTAWGEWGTEEILSLVGFVPRGMEQAATWWQALLPDYQIKALGEGRLAESAGYVISAVLGSALVYGLTVIFTKMLMKHGAK
jgi:hypothetical protein